MYNQNKQNEQIYGRNDMVMLDGHNKIYGSLGMAEQYVFNTVEGNPVVLPYPKAGKLKDVVTEFEMQGWTEQDGTPTLENPVPIVSAGNWNEETQKYEYGIEVGGANLFDYTTLINEDGYVPSNYVLSSPIIPFHVEEGKRYVLITKWSNQGIDGLYSSIYFGEDNLSYKDLSTYILATGTGAYAFYNGAQIRFVLTANKTCDITRCIVHGSMIMENAYIVEEFGLFDYIDGANEKYEPYRLPQTVTLTSDRPLTKWDKLEKRGGQWGWVYKSDEYTMTGEEAFYVASESYIGELTSDSYINVNNLQELNGCCGFSNYLKIYVGVWHGNFDGVEGFAYNGTQIHVRISNEDTGAVAGDTIEKVRDKIKAYCAQRYADGTPFIFWHETAEETFVPLSESEQEHMNELTMNTPTTVISNDVEANMKITYKSIQTEETVSEPTD